MSDTRYRGGPLSGRLITETGESSVGAATDPTGPRPLRDCTLPPPGARSLRPQTLGRGVVDYNWTKAITETVCGPYTEPVQGRESHRAKE